MTRAYRKHPWESLKVGESFQVEGIDATAMRVSASYAGRRYNRYFAVNQTAPGCFTITRLPLKQKKRQRNYPWPKKVGTSFTLPPGTRWVAQKAWQAGKRLKRKYKVTRIKDNQHKVTRVA